MVIAFYGEPVGFVHAWFVVLNLTSLAFYADFLTNLWCKIFTKGLAKWDFVSKIPLAQIVTEDIPWSKNLPLKTQINIYF